MSKAQDVPFSQIEDLDLHALFSRFHKRGIQPLLEYHDAILREESELTVGERELIAAYVSSINGCHYCFSAHRDHARAWGIPEDAGFSEKGLFDILSVTAL